MFCEYKDIFGKPGEGVHKTRIGSTETFEGFALYDILGLVFLIIIVVYLTGYSILSVSIIGIISTILLHKLFCVKTTFNKMIFD